MGIAASSSSRTAARRGRSRAHVAKGMPARLAASRNACFSSDATRSSMYWSKRLSLLGRPRAAMYYLHCGKWGRSSSGVDKYHYCRCIVLMNRQSREPPAKGSFSFPNWSIRPVVPLARDSRSLRNGPEHGPAIVPVVVAEGVAGACEPAPAGIRWVGAVCASRWLAHRRGRRGTSPP